MKKRRTGFSLVELIIVVAIVAIIAMTAGPALYRLVPLQRLRGETQNVAGIMRQARLKAASGQRPVRVSLLCDQRSAERPCRLVMATAIYKNDGTVKDWDQIPNSGHELARQVYAHTSAADPPADLKPDTYFVIFMPSGRTFSWPQPFSLNFHADDLPGTVRPGWCLTVDNYSGRAFVNPIRPKPKG